VAGYGIGLIGREERNVDKKGRIFLPAKFRKRLPDGERDVFVVTPGLDRCLYVYPLSAWMRFQEKLRGLSIWDRRSRAVYRRMIDKAEEVHLDSQGRMLVPRRLLRLVGISNEVIIIGALDWLEVWDPAIYRSVEEEDERIVNEEDLGELLR